jgi:predicted signal transduction protein with EAL and GGDEF domain
MRLKSLAEPFSHGETCVEVSASIGITAYPESGATVNKLIFAADSVMYIAKTAISLKRLAVTSTVIIPRRSMTRWYDLTASNLL